VNHSNTSNEEPRNATGQPAGQRQDPPRIAVAHHLEAILALLHDAHLKADQSSLAQGRQPLDALLLCSLMLSTAVPSEDRASRVALAAVIEIYRAYRPLPPYLYPETELPEDKQVIAYAETERDAHRIASSVIATGVNSSVYKTSVLASLYPQGHPAYSPRAEIRWAVLVPGEVNISELRQTIYPEAKLSGLVQQIVAWYDRAMSERMPRAESDATEPGASDQTPALEQGQEDREERHD
jgi:hypothetical protein